MKRRIWIALGALALAGGVVAWLARPEGPAGDAGAGAAAVHGGAAGAREAPALPPGPGAAAADGSGAADPPGGPAAAEAPPYPVDLEELRGKIPNNRYWELGVPTSDPEIAKARAERAKRQNALFGRTQTGEATEQEIRDYYAEQRRVSQDYLELSLLVLAEKGAQLPERDRGMFELSAQLHRARLQQIERDLADALARRASRL